MTDKQQIEESLETLQNDLEEALEWDVSDHDTVDTFMTAINLTKQGYRKIPENAVVLTQEEYKALMLEQKRLKEIVDRIPCGYELKDKTRKEMAKEIFSKLREKSTESFLDEEGNICYLNEEYVSMRDIEAVLQQCSVEVE